MRKFNTLLEEISSTISDQYKAKLPNLFAGATKGRKSKSGVDGKYFKSQTNTSKSMISKQDRKKSSEKGRLTNTIDGEVAGGKTKVISSSAFEKMLNKSGDRSIDLSDGKEKSLNSKTSNYKIRKLKDGRVMIRKVR